MTEDLSRQHPAYKVAVVQASPGFMNLGAAVARACLLIEEAADNGANLIAFPECFLPGFPIWIFEMGMRGRASSLFRKLHDNSVALPGEAVRRISVAARKAGIYVAMGINEREGGTLYMTQLWFDDAGNIIGKHRKLKPTGAERLIWGEGDGSTMPVFDTPLGRLGGLLCWEHRLPLAAAVMSSQHEEVHVASWPFIDPFVGGRSLSSPDVTVGAGEAGRVSSPALPLESSSFEVINRAYALVTQTFVLVPTMVLTQDVIDAFCAGDDALRARFRAGVGNSRIIGPDGVTIGDILPPDQEGLIYADIALERLIFAKYMCDPAGHYSKSSVLSARFNRSPAPVVEQVGDPGATQRFSHEELNL